MRVDALCVRACGVCVGMLLLSRTITQQRMTALSKSAYRGEYTAVEKMVAAYTKKNNVTMFRARRAYPGGDSYT